MPTCHKTAPAALVASALSSSLRPARQPRPSNSSMRASTVVGPSRCDPTSSPADQRRGWTTWLDGVAERRLVQRTQQESKAAEKRSTGLEEQGSSKRRHGLRRKDSFELIRAFELDVSQAHEDCSGSIRGTSEGPLREARVLVESWREGEQGYL